MCSCSPPPPPTSAAHLPHSTDLTPGTSPFLPGSAPPCFQHSPIFTGSPCISPLIRQSLHPFGVFCQLLCLLNMPAAALLAVPVVFPSPHHHHHSGLSTPRERDPLTHNSCSPEPGLCWVFIALHGTEDTRVPVHPCPPGMPGDNRHKTPGDAT